MKTPDFQKIGSMTVSDFAHIFFSAASVCKTNKFQVLNLVLNRFLKYGSSKFFYKRHIVEFEVAAILKLNETEL